MSWFHLQTNQNLLDSNRYRAHTNTHSESNSGPVLLIFFFLSLFSSSFYCGLFFTLSIYCKVLWNKRNMLYCAHCVKLALCFFLPLYHSFGPFQAWSHPEEEDNTFVISLLVNVISQISFYHRVCKSLYESGPSRQQIWGSINKMHILFK